MQLFLALGVHLGSKCPNLNTQNEVVFGMSKFNDKLL